MKTYAWDFGEDAEPAGATSVGPHTTLYSKPGAKTVRLIVTNDFGSDTSYISITVSPDTPATPQPFSFSDTSCVGFQSYSIRTVEDASSYTWNLDNGGTIVGNTADTTVEINWNKAGLAYILSVTASNSCGTSLPLTAEIDVMDIAIADFNNNDASLTIDFTNFSTSAQSYSWDFGDGQTSNDKDPSHKYATKGVYTVKLTAENVCSDSTLEKEITVNYGVGVNEKSQSEFKLFPMPVEDILFIKNNGQKGDFILLDAMGRILLLERLEPGLNSLDVKHVAPGFYGWHMHSNGLIQQGKLLINR